MTAYKKLADLPWGLRSLVARLVWHTDVRWDVPDYVDDEAVVPDDRRATTDAEAVEAFSSCHEWSLDKPAEERRHALLIDLDVPAWLIPSSTGGHGHLYVDLDIPDDALWRFLAAAAEIGLVEEGYVNACHSRGMTSLRAPWIVKGEEPSTLRRQAELDAELDAERREQLAALPEQPLPQSGPMSRQLERDPF